MYSEALREQVSQGDLFREVAFARVSVTGDETSVTTSRRRAILLTYDCEFDKPRVKSVLIACVRSLSDISKDTQGNIRAGRLRSALYLPAHPPDLPESFVDLYQIVAIDKTEIQRLANEGQRLASLSDEGRLALQDRIHRFFSP
jgi:hypothetical protein